MSSSGWWALFGTSFAAVFVAELGDKTQLAALALAASSKQTLAVFLGASAALVLASALAVGAGRLLADRVDPRALHYAGAALFLVIGLVMLVRGPEAEGAAATQEAAAQEAAAQELPRQE
ncbi:MAG: TMEM165/GDT1 family protein [Planctomycetota bacterium]